VKGQFQKTIAKEGKISGIGLHTAQPCTLILRPASVDTGIRFLQHGQPVDLLSTDGDFGFSADSLRCSYIGGEKNRILTVEHILASLRGLGITNLVIDVLGSEIPGLDGSALPFVQRLKELGIIDQDKALDFYRIPEPIFCYDKNKAIAIYPTDSFSVSYLLDYEHPYLRNQKMDFVLTPEAFETQIAPARTFCTDVEARELQKSGFGLGASLENTLVVTENGSHRSQLRFENEPARHKVLDILGDFNLLGFPVLGHVVAIRSGHVLNRKLVMAIKKQRESMGTKKQNEPASKMPMELEEIKKVLPHRYPFLLVDRVLEMGENHIVAIKNVSGCESFFQGHFPERPVMPGVLIVEAIAQAGGVLMLSKPQHKGKMAFLAAVNAARFRRIVIPGDQLRLEVQVLKYKSRVGIVKGVAKVGKEVACEVEIMFSLAD
jgi:UDP-3-O-[3-hydroxymyristoyl] N-acetylglucosamine deacetylase/3-hydroxyacyl-[acyl-carrier-protein] dehydratase